MKPRPELEWFARRMEDKLFQKDFKGGWQKETYMSLLRGMMLEIVELTEAITEKDSNEIIDEAVDVANYAMMMADNARRMR